MLSTLFPQESYFREAGHSVHTSTSLIKKDNSLHITKHLTTLGNNFSPESILERCFKTVHVLICETQRVLFLL